MTKTYLKKLIDLSYHKDQQINQANAQTIANLLKRADLKKYLNALRSLEEKRTVMITSATALSAQQQKELAKEFSDKTIEYQINPALMIGIEITNNDIVYNNNLKQRFASLTQHLSE